MRIGPRVSTGKHMGTVYSSMEYIHFANAFFPIFLSFFFFFFWRMDLREIGYEGVKWIHLAQNMDQWRPFVNTVMNFRVS
jgi:hypothetical protein